MNYQTHIPTYVLSVIYRDSEMEMVLNVTSISREYDNFCDEDVCTICFESLICKFSCAKIVGTCPTTELPVPFCKRKQLLTQKEKKK